MFVKHSYAPLPWRPLWRKWMETAKYWNFFKSKEHYSISKVARSYPKPNLTQISHHFILFSEFNILVPNENWCTRNKQVTLNVEPDLIKFFSNTLSKAGSKSSSISSIRRGRPSDKASSKWARKYLWFNEVT